MYVFRYYHFPEGSSLAVTWPSSTLTQLMNERTI